MRLGVGRTQGIQGKEMWEDLPWVRKPVNPTYPGYIPGRD